MIANFSDTQKQIAMYKEATFFLHDVVKTNVEYSLAFMNYCRNTIDEAIKLLSSLGLLSAEIKSRVYPITIVKFDKQNVFANLGEYPMVDFGKNMIFSDVVRDLIVHFELNIL